MIYTVTPNPGLDRTLTVPTILFNEMVRATESRLDWGGKGFNVSRALHALGVESVAMGFLGGSTGQMLEQGLQHLGIATDMVTIAGETRTNTVVMEAAADRYVKVNEMGPRLQPEEVDAFFDRVREKVRPNDIWVMSGSLPLGVPADFYARLIGLVQGEGARAVLDTSGPPLRLGVAAGPYLVKPNALEAAEITGWAIASVADRREAATFFLEQGIDIVALSLGAEGALLARQGEMAWARPPEVQARNPVGAGDALLAGLIWALTQEFSLAEMARLGVAAGTAAAVREGVSVGSRAEVEGMAERVRVE